MVGKWTSDPCSVVDEIVNTFWVLTDESGIEIGAILTQPGDDGMD